MNKLNKRLKKIYNKFDKNMFYNFEDAINILKKNKISNFIESVDIAINLNTYKNKIKYNINNFLVLPYNIKKKKKIVVFAKGKDAITAKENGANFVGMENLLELIKKNKIKYDVVIATPDTIKLIKVLGPILGPKGLMPNYKLDTVTNNIKDSIKNIQNGKINYKNDKNGIIHTTIGKINFENYKLKKNLKYLILNIKKQNYNLNKNTFFKKITLSTTMGVGINIIISDLL
ncbi:50S ribosomal protein L1 [Candidatus Annandia adelgestsuga]|uniref:Ribosomal protein n=1 Tax=Candidatus Annandia adelgestsuga TaxID=1302411 RepID=A0A3S5HNX2_9ENTR|nr:50S ribosomal protein L1 [Candidatus Annandia adelgestsuga]AZP36292.1 50S ribosomal protein L1 [Candidatus Annandia adelgestsuga]